MHDMISCAGETCCPWTGVMEFVAWCRSQGFQTAIVSSADEAKLIINLRELGFPPDIFS